MGNTPTADREGRRAVLLMAIATFMILDQLKIANNIVVITCAMRSLFDVGSVQLA